MSDSEEKFDKREDTELRAFIDSLGTAAFGIITVQGYRDLKEKFDSHTRHTYNLAKIVLIGMLVQLAVIGYVFWTDYQGRIDQVTAGREGCERDKKDRIVNAEGWRTAEKARRDAGEFKVADRYKSYAVEMEQRGRVNCVERYPNASLLP